MVFQSVAVGEPEQAQKVDRIAVEHLVVGDVDAVVVDDEIGGAGQLAAAAREGEEQPVETRDVAGLLFLKRRAEDTGEVADILGDQEIVLHETLDRRQAGMALVAEPVGDIALDVEMQPLLGLAGQEMHVAAHRPQEILGLLELVELVAREHTLRDQFFHGTLTVEIFADPEQGLQIAQAALAVLDVGLDQIAAFTTLAMPFVALGKLGLCIFGAGIAHHFAVEAGDQLVAKRFFAPDEARFQNGGADRHVGARQPQAFLDVAGGVADLQPHVPQHVEHVFDDLLAPGRLLVGQEEQEIDVGARRQRAAAITADGDDRHALGRGRVLGAIDMGDGEIVERGDDLIHQMRQPLGAGDAAAILHQHLFGDLAPAGDALLKDKQHGGARRRAGAVAIGFGGQRRQFLAQRLAVDDLVELEGNLRHSSQLAPFRRRL